MSKYFPIFRGKQFELIAIREFAANGPKGIVHPIIEPVRDPEGNKGLLRAVEALENSRVKYTIVVNPSKGHVAKKHDGIETIVGHLGDTKATADNLSFGLLFHAGGSTDEALDIIDGSPLKNAALNLVYDLPSAAAGDVGKLKARTIDHHVVEDKSAVRKLNAFDKPSFVHLLRNFKRLKSNLDYVGVAPSLFCSEHLYLEEDGFAGLADFLTIGDAYSESGSLPLALVIHLTFVNVDDENKIYVAHFCSDTNADTSDPGNKFKEAVAKLIEFVDDRSLPENPAIKGFREYHDAQKFPGLGMVKKLSMLNHLYVMDAALRTE